MKMTHNFGGTMASSATGTAAAAGIADLLSVLLDADGSARHAFVTGHLRAAGVESGRSLADAVHHLSALHGRHPGISDLLLEREHHPAIREWIEAAAHAFRRERNYLTRVVVAAGPMPSTPGQAQSEAAVLGQRHAIEMLARSDRIGCALGAAMAKALDWRSLRAVIDAAAQRYGVEPPTLLVPSLAETLRAATDAATSPSVERAIAFGAQQMLVQHRGLWDLLEAREIARRGS